MRLFTVDNASLARIPSRTWTSPPARQKTEKMSAEKYLGICLSLLLLLNFQNTGLSTQCWEDTV